jgi:hypothetical protein
MACRINGNTVRKGMTSFLDRELMGTSIFEKDGDSYMAKPSQYFAAQEFVGGLNRKFSEDVIRKNSDTRYSIAISDALVKQYVNSSQAGQELSTLVGLYADFAISPESWNEGETFQALNYPEVSEFTYNQLISFLKSLNPNFRVEEIDNMSEDAVTNVKDFLIKVKSMAKFSAMPEEVAHAFIELLPDTNPLKQEIINNVNNFPIYGQTLARYGEVYTKEDGSPDYDKIKREAAAKLVGEYVTAIANDDFTRVKGLTEVKQGWLKRWFAKFMEWLGLGMLDHTKSYADVAGIILSGTTDETLKSAKEIEDITYTDSYFFRLSEKEAYANAAEIVDAKPALLLENIAKFTKEFGRKFNEILKEDQYAELNEMLKRNGADIGKINRMSEVSVLLGEARVDLKAAMDSATFLGGVKQFLEAVDRLDILSSSILKVVKSKKDAQNFDEALTNIKELEGYFGIYETFNNLISAELAQSLIDANVGEDVIESIQRTQTSFKVVNDHILTKLRKDLFIFYKSMLQESNNVAAQTLAEDMERFKDDPQAMKLFQQRMDKLVTTDQDIIKMLSGKGRDIDNFSSLNHLINAAHTNGDVFLASISRYIQRKVEFQQNAAQTVVRDLYQRIDPIQKALNEDAVETGKKISFLDTVFDNDTGETRQVLTWHNPHRGISVALEGHRRRVKEAAIARNELDEKTPEYTQAVEDFKAAQTAYNDFLEKYMHRPFVNEYYNFNKKYENNTDFIEQMGKWQELSEFMRDDEVFLQVEPENEDVQQQLAQTRRERANLLNENDLNGIQKVPSELAKVLILKQYFEESNSFKEEDEVQTERSFMIARNRYEQKVDYALTQARESNAREIGDIETVLKESLKDPRIRIQTLYAEANELEDNTNWDFIKKLLMAKWTKKNRSIQRNEAFYEFEAEVFKQLEELQGKGELSEVEEKIKAAYTAIRTTMFGTRDNIGHVNPDSLTQEDKERIIDLEDLIAELRLDRPGIGVNVEDFSDADRNRYDDLGAVVNDESLPSDRRRAAMRERSKIAGKYKNVGKAKVISDLIKVLGGLTQKVPTTYYWDRMVPFINHVAEFGRYVKTLNLNKEATEEVDNLTYDFIEAIDTEDWDRLDFVIYERETFDTFLDWLRDENPKEYNWFVDSHSTKTVFDGENGQYVKLKNARSAIYSFTEPVLPEHQVEVYNRRFRKQRVKDDFRTGYNPETKKVELQVGRHVTNREYNGFPEFLPLTREDGAPADSIYHNQAYYDLAANDPLRFQYLQELKAAHLAEQERLPARLRTWMAVPVMDLSNIESIQPDHLKDVAKSKWDYVKSIFKRNQNADAEAQAEGMDTIQEIDQMTQTMIYDRIPKLGMSQKLDVNRVSRDLLKSTAQMIFRAHEFTGRTQAEPVVKALIRVMKDNAFKNNMSNKERAKKFESVYAQMILQEVPETTLNSKAVRRIAKFLTGNTALRMLADPIGGVINYASAMVNDTIEASAGKYLNFTELLKGKALAFRVNTALMADYNKKANLSYYTLLFDTFDMIQGEFEEDLLDRSSSKDKHASVRQMLMIPRKAGELLAQTAVAMGILERNKVKNEIDGKMYPVHEIYKKEGNNLKLKEGFPAEYEINGPKFIKLQELIHRINLELHGNYAKVSQSEASRYALGKLAENMKRWFMPAFQRRFGRETVDVTLESLNEGYYRTTGRAFRNIFGAMFHLDFGGAKNWLNVFLKTPRYRQNLSRMGAELAQATIMFIIFALVLGYSGDDKNKQLENNSWIHNTSILIALRVYSETTAYIPFPPFGFQEMKRNVLTPFSLPSDAVSNFAAIAQLGLYQAAYWMGADSLYKNLYYSKDSGFWYSNKGDSKLFKYILNTFGHSGYHINPEQYIKQFDNLQGRLK